MLVSDRENRSTPVVMEDVPITPFRHVFLSVQWFYANSNQGTSSSGTLSQRWVVSIRTVGNVYWENPDDYIIYIKDADRETKSWTANTVDITVTPEALPLQVYEWQATVTATLT